MLTWIIVIFLVILILYYESKKPNNFPPGPPRLPFLGYIPFVQSHLTHKAFRDLSKYYGPVIGIYLGRKPCIIANSGEAIKSILLNDDMNGRMVDEDFIKARTWGKTMGVIFTEKEEWQSQRRFLLHQLRNLGFGKKPHELIIYEDIIDMVETIKNLRNTGFVIQKEVAVANINILWAIMGGNMFKRSDPQLKELVDIINLLFQSGSFVGNAASSLPLLRPFIAEVSGYNGIVRGFVTVRNFITDNLEKHKKIAKDGVIENFFDAYLAQLKNPPHESFTERQLVAVCMDMFAAGVETVSSLVSFDIMYMCLFPEVQQKIQEELDAVVGKERMVLMSDRLSLPILDSAYHEVFRMRNPAVSTVPHSALRNSTIQGYDVPKGTLLIANLYAHHMDPEIWGDPEVFRPERFLENGKIKKDDNFMPFGKGKRNCIGESLARMSTFLIFANLLLKFSFKFDPSSPPKDTEGVAGFTLAPPHYKVIAMER